MTSKFEQLKKNKEENFQCPYCKSKFSQKCNLTRHVKQKHEENMGETKDKTQDQAESDQKSSEANQVDIAIPIEENQKTTNDFKKSKSNEIFPDIQTEVDSDHPVLAKIESDVKENETGMI